jgi:hypothetical protein
MINYSGQRPEIATRLSRRLRLSFADRAGNFGPHMATYRPSGGGDAVGDIHPRHAASELVADSSAERDLLALKSAFQRRDAGGDITFLAVFQRHPGAQGLGITVRVVARP